MTLNPKDHPKNCVVLIRLMSQAVDWDSMRSGTYTSGSYPNTKVTYGPVRKVEIIGWSPNSQAVEIMPNPMDRKTEWIMVADYEVVDVLC